MAFQIESPAFENGGIIPKKYTCDGENVSPPLRWKEIPEGTESLALICDDPDAPMMTWVHWILYNIPPDTEGLEEGTNLKGAVYGKNSWGKLGYGGPCPPKGKPHRYFFKLYALDSKLSEEGMKKKNLLKEMEGHVLAKAELMGMYGR